ncbi:hypothetical protein B0T17DRAFT_613171 [Bombardia bombarda]|uniref:Uncharacterized protein n=1 Tax=Bombardia bombarda TaxID=252184 RepID=A0AA40CFJ6_9PEZI|nr:hypothetical protein B0T17DRAFT_613171 [Bombardia bombarda]
MQNHIVTTSSPLPATFLQQIALAGPLDEISNHPGAVRHHLFWHGDRDRTTNTLRRSMLFFVYQTGRHGPQNGFRLCVAHRGFHIASPTKMERKEGGEGEEDDIDQLERVIPQGHVEVVVLGEAPVLEDDEDDEDGDVNEGEDGNEIEDGKGQN